MQHLFVTNETKLGSIGIIGVINGGKGGLIKNLEVLEAEKIMGELQPPSPSTLRL